MALDNTKLFNFVGEWVELCNPDTVYMCDDSDADAETVRKRSMEIGEEIPLAKEGVGRQRLPRTDAPDKPPGEATRAPERSPRTASERIQPAPSPTDASAAPRTRVRSLLLALLLVLLLTMTANREILLELTV